MRRRITTIAGALLVLAGCTDNETKTAGPTGPVTRTDPTAVPNVVSETSTELWASIVTGETGPGSQYQLYLPRVWNGRLLRHS